MEHRRPPGSSVEQRRPRKRPRLAVDVVAPSVELERQLAEDLAEVDAEGPADLRQGVCAVHSVGRGAAGEVSLGIYVPTMKMVAVKAVSVYDEEHERQTMGEIHAVHEQLVPIDSQGVPVWLFHYHLSVGDVHVRSFSFFVAFAVF